MNDVENIKVGVVGLGLMGSSIATNFLIAGHEVVGIAPIPADMVGASDRIDAHLTQCRDLSLLKKDEAYYRSRLVLSEDYASLQGCALVLECVIEHEEIKRTVYDLIETNVDRDTVIGTNTSAIPISQLQKSLEHPDRFLGIHWAEPAYATRFLEIICGDQTDMRHAQFAYDLAEQWGKEPTLLRKDIRGFITNRLMYAVYREGLALLEDGSATLEDLDKAFQYDVGSWVSIMGIFQRMDYLGIDRYSKMVEEIFPMLSKMEHAPAIMEKMVDENAAGIRNGKGLYNYTDEEAKKWEKVYMDFSKDIYNLINKTR